jgi:protein-L-isoaspartate(D-aspartate) O-methyltransferase
MVREQIEMRGITDSQTLIAMKKVPRHLFVPEEMKTYAYEDRPLPIGYSQTISQPFIVAYMTASILPRPDFKVLEIGTGSGYQAAVVAEIVDSVFTIEIVPELAEQAKSTFRALNYNNIICRKGDGFHGWPEHSPFDAILVTAAIDEIPGPLIDQLKEGGKMIIPVGAVNSPQNLVLITKKRSGISTETLIPVRFVPFIRE